LPRVWSPVRKEKEGEGRGERKGKEGRRGEQRKGKKRKITPDKPLVRY
jgi:hypothetical protein